MKTFLYIFVALFCANSVMAQVITLYNEASQDAYVSGGTYEIYGNAIFDFANIGDIFIENVDLNINDSDAPLIRPSTTETGSLLVTYNDSSNTMSYSITTPLGGTMTATIPTSLTGHPDSKLEALRVEANWISGSIGGFLAINNVNGVGVSMSSLNDNSNPNNPRVAYGFTNLPAGNFTVSGLISLPITFGSGAEFDFDIFAEIVPVPEVDSTWVAVGLLLLAMSRRPRRRVMNTLA